MTRIIAKTDPQEAISSTPAARPPSKAGTHSQAGSAGSAQQGGQHAGSFGPPAGRVDRRLLTPLLQQVDRPGRYVGGEFGRPAKDPGVARASVVLSYPDTYELGMSNQGLKILYDLVNRQPGFFADRAFLPWPDMGEAMQQNNIPLYSLDHFLFVRSFDVWGFNTAHELHFTNILHALDLAGIPLMRSQRGGDVPLIITGGTAVSNPLPIFDFVDGIFMGDGEEGLIEILEIVAAGKERGATRAEILEDLRAVEGLLLPEFYEMHEQPGQYPVYKGPLVNKRNFFSKEFAALEYFLVPNIDIIQDRVVVEVNRGCGQGCRFCHAGFWKRPVRTAEVDTLVRIAEDMLARTGNDSISLHSLSLADYRWLEELVVAMANKFGPDGISLSLPSLRVQVKTIPVLQMTQGIRRSSVTFALEAGSELMRERIRKKSSEENLHYLIREIFSRGWDLVKVYFMAGLPDRDGGETEDLIRALNALGTLAEECGSRKNVNVTVSLFVPKPFTTFQWEEQRTPEYFRETIAKIKAGLRSKRVHLKYPDPWMAYVEGLLSRGDSRVGAVILEAYKRGARFDSWDDAFRMDVWQGILAELPADLKSLWLEKRTGGSPVPWHDLIEGKTISIEKLTTDFEKFEAVTEENMNPPHPQALHTSTFPEELLKPVTIPEDKFTTRQVVELEFSKTGSLIYISHLNLAEVVRKAARRARLPMTFSNGFNKHEKLHLAEALPLYVHSDSERVFIELYRPIDQAFVQSGLPHNLPEGLLLKSIRLHPKRPKMPSPPAYSYRLEFSDVADLERARQLLLSPPQTLVVQRKERKKKKLHKLRRGENAMRSVQKSLAECIEVVEVKAKASEDRNPDGSPGWPNVLRFVLESANTGAVSMADLVTRYLEIPVADWNSRLRVVREGPARLSRERARISSAGSVAPDEVQADVTASDAGDLPMADSALAGGEEK